MKCISTKNATEWKGRTIEIDDAGTGDLVGDAFIGLHDTSNGKIIFRGIPVGLYKKGNRSEDRPKKEILSVVKDGLKSLHFNKDKDRILLCRGDCFDLVREYFEQEDINYVPAIVEGKLQDAVEDKFFSHLRNLGIRSKIDVNDYKGRFFTLFNWVCQDYPNRKHFVKSGFPAWEKRWKKKAKRRYKAKIKKRQEIKKRAEKIAKQI
ncbi:MAG: hypothetical protein GF311_11735 [Candidatus Lokiarchaeota archaeon]|nr:hypothetical protein [Candidatus Lokiarchaeota archaeon]